MRNSWLMAVLVTFAVTTGVTEDAPKIIDTDKSVLTIRAYKTGLFSRFAHDHEISAPIQKGYFSEAKPSVELTVDARKMKVMDKEVSDKDRARIQGTMLGADVLDSEKYPEIRFRSTNMESRGAGKWLVHGDLSLHGQTRPVAVNIETKGGHYLGTAVLKQTEFGITPVSIGGGTVKVKDELKVEFDVVPHP